MEIILYLKSKSHIIVFRTIFLKKLLSRINIFVLFPNSYKINFMFENESSQGYNMKASTFEMII